MIYQMVPFSMTLNYLKWISKISNNVERRAASLRQLSFLLT